MHDFHAWVRPRIAAAHARALGVYHSHRARKAALIVAIVLVVYGLLGFFAAPPIIRGQIQKRATAALGRQVTVGHVRFDPYTLRLQLDRLQVAGSAGQPPFVAIDQTVINASWASLFRLAPVLDVLSLQHPQIRIAHTAPGQFNFSDILGRLAAQPSSSKSPFRYAVSNISIQDGTIDFTDAVTRSTHHIDHIDIGIPFLANLPRDTNVFVKPLLEMDVDGSPIRIAGQTRPFAYDRESAIDFHFQRLDLPRYLAYAPTALPFGVPAGTLSGDITLHFIQTAATPEVRLSGTLLFDNLALDSAQHQPILALRRGNMQLLDVEPLVSRYDFGAMQLDGAGLWYTQTGSGHSNFDSLLAMSAPAAKGAKPAPPTHLRIGSLTLKDSTFHYAGADKHSLKVDQLGGSIAGLSLTAAPAAKLDLAGRLDGGGIAAKGTLDLAASKLAAALTLQQVGLAPLQGVAAMPLDGPMANGKLSASGDVQLDWGKAFDVQLSKTHVTVTDFALQPRDRGAAVPVAWKSLDAMLDTFDLARHTAQLGVITADGLNLNVQRWRDKRIDLLELFASKPPHNGAATEKSPAWHWSVAHVGFKQASVAFTDHAAGPKPITVKLDKLDGSLDKLSDKLDAASPIKLSGAIGRGTFDLAGTLGPSPLSADLKVETKRLGIAAFEPYIGVPLNVTLARAAITSHGTLHYATHGTQPHIVYRGDAALDNVNIKDKLTGDDFLRWRVLAATRLSATYGSGMPRIDIGHLSLTAFYARMIINANGRLNVSDVIANPAAAPVSVTRANNAPAPAPKPTGTTRLATAIATAAPATATSVASASVPAAPTADIHIGGITLAYGQLNFTDNFIKPNYTANLTQLHGKIGAFGTTPNAPPASIDLEAALNDNAPVAIGGSMNPLQPQAQLDVTGKATGVELDRVSTYSAKYTGYPITAGKLNADVHYTLDQRKLSANNHFFITQLTFGDRDESPGVKHLPVKLAVALLKDSQGNIDINLPVSGSLDNPQFSIGGLVWRAVVGLITKAVTAPFRLLGAAFGGSHNEDLDYVAFAPGSAVLDKNAQARLIQIAAMLTKKPGLTLQLTGRVDPAKDVAGLRKVTVDDMIRLAKLQATNGKHTDVSLAALAAVQITPDEYVKYLKRAYKHDDFKGKPRDYLGLKLPKPAEMHKLMEANVPTDTKALQTLARRRADAVRMWLAAGKLAANRIVVEAPKLNDDGIDDKGPATRVQFGIAQR